MEEIRKDMENSVLLPLLIRAPLDWGTVHHGKLSGDQWRIICTIHLPITLVRLWGPSLVPRWWQMVKNFMDLYKAMETAQNRIISKEHVTSYENHIIKYLKGVNHLYKDFMMKPIHHMAQHLGEFMLQMGPVHAYHVPAFERLNFLMQQENTNLKIGLLFSRRGWVQRYS
ncbi:hypothetical protein EDD18DRAFT_1077839 [Armillaria luteobubalina]|uniref:Uncharacterized protein n=1 Tax=Armillaria luteobubalina TaxID=153913 RepID=A0AA39Q1E2_9AGAR|nr:hypothetical protein EDD18DRAFT_1077839 [Armillaria luteobubalina]